MLILHTCINDVASLNYPLKAEVGNSYTTRAHQVGQYTTVSEYVLAPVSTSGRSTAPTINHIQVLMSAQINSVNTY